jgi:transposase-like protein
LIKCPHCGGIYSVERIKKGSAEDDFPVFQNGVKKKAGKARYDLFLCRDCGRTFRAEGKTWREERKFG